ncbi:MAG: NCS2 family permease [Methanococci archaeon]|uniref:Xanthine/uracil/vitamin C permease n=1 Tax=Methanocaldococcus vulcanius (strain ATCC 700851 / DSM 12094 / M7) TaxID=579137 RepID=C9RFX2_METVM|nr:NCS2 family permease [Methanocaldococcus vulcanius]ACX72474.1 Xanthine/uracil/vitamin C permease [Methanocaldococcus vulcanius M7]NPA63176.1 NCS2 family permease [Methanococci archaeon]
MGFIEEYFEFDKYNTNLKIEVLAGITTFMTMAYIIFVNPQILSTTGMDFGAVMVATCISSAIATLIMGLYARYPFALAPGMGLNAYFTYGVCLGMGIDWRVALGAVFISGVLFVILTLTKIRTWIFNVIPNAIKYGTAVGIGLFIAFIGLKNAGIIVESKATLVTLGNIMNPSALLAMFGIFLTSILVSRNVIGAILLGIIITSLLGMILGISPFPDGIFSMPPSIAPTFLQLDVMGALNLGLLTIVLAFFFVDMFDTLGTLSALASQAGYLDEEGKLPRVEKALMADATGTVVGSLLGTSTVTTYIESASGIAIGGRTGFVSVVVAVLFLLALFFYPVVKAIPAYATASALVIVGALMMRSVKFIDFDDYTEAIPAFITLLTIPLTYSIATGLALGFITYPILKVFTGRWREVHWLVYLLAVLFALRFVYLSS